MVSRKIYIAVFFLSLLSVGTFVSSNVLAAAKIEANPNGFALDPGEVDVKKIETKDIVAGTLNAAYAIAAVIAVIVIIAAGLMYITSDGDPGKTSTAKNAIIYALIGLVIVGSAFIITGIVQNIASDSPEAYINTTGKTT